MSKIIIYGYYWDDFNYTNGEVWGFTTAKAAKEHAKLYHGYSKMVRMIKHELNNDKPLDIYTGE